MNDVKSFPSIPDENLYSLLSLSNPKSVSTNTPLSNSSSPLSNNENSNNGIGSLLSSKKDNIITSSSSSILEHRIQDDRPIMNYFNPLKQINLNNNNNNNNNSNNNNNNNNNQMNNNGSNNNQLLIQNRLPYSFFPLNNTSLYNHNENPLSNTNNIQSNSSNNTNNSNNNMNINNLNQQPTQNILQSSLDLINSHDDLADFGIDYSMSNLLYDENYTNITSLICCKCNNKQNVENKVFLSNNINVIPGPEDKNYEFRCFNCSKGQFYFRHLFKTWKEMIHTSLFNLEREKKYRFSHYREIIKYVHKHSKELLADREKVLNTKMKNIMTATLSYNRKIFISFARDSGMWSNYRQGDNIEEDERGLLTWKGNDQWEGYIEKDSQHTLICKSCSKSTKFEMKDLQGSNVLPGPLDSRFEFSCENCSPNKKPTLKHLSKSWKEVAHTALYNLEIIKKYRFSHQIEIASYVKSHQDSFAFNREMDNIKNRLSTVLSRYKKAFTSIGRYTGMWSNWRDGDENLQELQDIEDDDEEESNEFDGVDPDNLEKGKSGMGSPSKKSNLSSPKKNKSKKNKKSSSPTSTSSSTTNSPSKLIKNSNSTTTTSVSNNSTMNKPNQSNSTPSKLKNISNSNNLPTPHQSNNSSASNCSSLVGSPISSEFFSSPKKTPLLPTLNSIDNNNSFSISESVNNPNNLPNNSNNTLSHPNNNNSNTNMIIHNQLPQNLIQQNYLHFNNQNNQNNQNISPKLSPDSSTTTPILSNSPNFNFYSNVYYPTNTPTSGNQIHNSIFNNSNIIHKNNLECCICLKNKQILQKCKNHICNKAICKECISNNQNGFINKQFGNETYCPDCNSHLTENSNNPNSYNSNTYNNFNSNYNYMYYNNNSNSTNSNNTSSSSPSQNNPYMNEINYSVNSLGEHSYISDIIKGGFKNQNSSSFMTSLHQPQSFNQHTSPQQSLLLSTLHQQQQQLNNNSSLNHYHHQATPQSQQQIQLQLQNAQQQQQNSQQLQQPTPQSSSNGSNSPNSKQKRKINEKNSNDSNKEKRSKGFIDHTPTFDSQQAQQQQQQLQQTPPLNLLSMSIHSSPQHPTTPLHHSQSHQSIHSSPINQTHNGHHNTSHHNNSNDYYHHNTGHPNILNSPVHHSNNHLTSPIHSQYYFDMPHSTHQRNLFSAPQYCGNNNNNQQQQQQQQQQQNQQNQNHSIHLPFQMPTPNFTSSLITLPTINDFSNDHHSHHSPSNTSGNPTTNNNSNNSNNTNSNNTNGNNTNGNNNINSLAQSSSNIPPPSSSTLIGSLTNPLIKSI